MSLEMKEKEKVIVSGREQLELVNKNNEKEQGFLKAELTSLQEQLTTSKQENEQVIM